MDASQLHILVVDDSVDTTDSMVELLALWGYDAVGCYCTPSALESARVSQPAAVILDLIMPGMDGFKFAELFRKLPGCETVPLIATTGCSSPASRHRALSVGIEHYVLKPANSALLERLLARATKETAIPLPMRLKLPVPVAPFGGEWHNSQRSQSLCVSAAEAVLA